MTKQFDEYIKEMGFEKYPFRDRTAEQEDTGKLFIKPEQYPLLLDSYDDNHTCIINGDRGTGKTIIVDDLLRRRENGTLIANISNYERVSLNNNLLDFYNLIIQEITRNLLVYINHNPKIIKKMTHEEKILVSFLIMKYGEFITDSQLKKQIESIQLSKFRRFLNVIAKPLINIINYGGTAITNFGNQFLTNIFGPYFPNVSSDEIIKIFPDIKFDIEDDFKHIQVSYTMLNTILEYIHQITGNKIIVFMDKFDEDSRIENDADITAKFLKELLSDNALLLNDNLQMIISVWKIAFKGLSTNFRKSKHYVYNISWSVEYLKNVLNHRLQVFSNNKVNKWEDMFENNFSEFNNILDLANGNPRDLWDLMDNIVRAQYELDNSITKISNDAVVLGMKGFVSNFNFYEYYPKRKNARKNTNDIYSYIAILLFLKKTDEFTNEELREAATAGGSITNYITSMQTIGLVEKTDRKRPGGAVIYKIIDPKVRYAIYNEIEISH